MESAVFQSLQGCLWAPQTTGFVSTAQPRVRCVAPVLPLQDGTLGASSAFWTLMSEALYKVSRLVLTRASNTSLWGLGS